MSSPSTDPDPSNPEPRAFEKWRRRAAEIAGIGHEQSTCEKWKRFHLAYSPSVVFLLKHLRLSGCAVPEENIICAPCKAAHSGGFTPGVGAVVLCQGRALSKQRAEDTLVHELVHMYDHCKFKVDWGNLRHHACSEIRASSLSGDCKLTRELQRGVLAFAKHHQACVRRRAVISVQANSACPDKAAAERAVNEVWESCFNDTRPFDEIY